MITLSEYDITAAFQAIEDELIRSMMRNMDRHRAEETKEGIEWSMWQVEQLKSLEKYKRDNQKKYQKQFKSINGEIGVLIREARAKGNMQQEITILDAIKKGFTPKRMARGATAEFFRINDRKLESLIKATTNDMQRAETAILRKANDDYRKAIYNAQVYANSGAGTYEKAVDMATKDMLSRGLNCVQYANGSRHTLADYADMAIRTASKRAYLQGEGEKRQEWGIATVIVNKRGNPCPKCLPFCGKVLIDDVWSGGKKEDGPYPLMSTAISAGLYHPRCKDSHTTYFPGISTADDTWTTDELKKIGQANRQETDQQYAARQARRFLRLSNQSLDPQNKAYYKAKSDDWFREQDKLLMDQATKFPDRNDADHYYRDKTAAIWPSLITEEREALWKYTGSSYSPMNRALRSGTVSQLPQHLQKYITDMKSALDKCHLEDDVWVRRGVSAQGLSGFLNVNITNLSDPSVQKQLIDTFCTEKGFMSTGVASGAGFTGINLDICLPKGSKAIYAEPFSQYGGTNDNGTWDGLQKANYIGGEAEVIVQCNSTFKVKEIRSNSQGMITDVVLLLVKQAP